MKTKMRCQLENQSKEVIQHLNSEQLAVLKKVFKKKFASGKIVSSGESGHQTSQDQDSKATILLFQDQSLELKNQRG